jgi:hypothetical protein
MKTDQLVHSQESKVKLKGQPTANGSIVEIVSVWDSKLWMVSAVSSAVLERPAHLLVLDLE